MSKSPSPTAACAALTSTHSPRAGASLSCLSSPDTRLSGMSHVSETKLPSSRPANASASAHRSPAACSAGRAKRATRTIAQMKSTPMYAQWHFPRWLLQLMHHARMVSTTMGPPLKAGSLPPFVHTSALSSRSRTRSSPPTPLRCYVLASPFIPHSRRTAAVRARRSVWSALAGWDITPSSGLRPWGRRCTPLRLSLRRSMMSSRWAQTMSST